MKIGLVSQAYPPLSQGGIATQTALKAQGLTALGHDVRVISHGSEPSVTTDGAIQVLRVSGWDDQMTLWTDPARWITWSAVVAAAVAACHADDPFDLVDFPEWGAEGYLHLLNSSPDAPAATIHIHGPLAMLAHAIGWPEQDSDLYRVGMHMEGACLARADGLYSSSDLSTDWCAKYHEVDRDRIPTIHAGVDTELFSPAPSEPSEPIVVFVGRIAHNKGVEDLVHAAAQLRRDVPDLRLVLAGAGDEPYTESLIRLIDDLGLADAVELVGSVDRGELPGLLRQARVFAAPSHYEGGPGLVYLEAMACGVPVIACHGSGATEIVRDGDNGLLIAPSDRDGLHSALRRLLDDDGLRRDLGRSARADAEALDTRLCVRQIESFYGALIEARR